MIFPIGDDQIQGGPPPHLQLPSHLHQYHRLHLSDDRPLWIVVCDRRRDFSCFGGGWHRYTWVDHGHVHAWELHAFTWKHAFPLGLRRQHRGGDRQHEVHYLLSRHGNTGRLGTHLYRRNQHDSLRGCLGSDRWSDGRLSSHVS